MNRHGSTKFNRGFIAPFLLTRSVHFLAAIWHNLSPPLTYQHSIIVWQHRQARAFLALGFGSIHLPPALLTAPRFFIV
jgi:hypothetical protein